MAIITNNSKGDDKQVSYEGCVLDKYERNMYDDSDFMAIVWDEPTQSVKHIEYATTRFWTYNNGASIDATPDVIEKARAYCYVSALATVKALAQREAEKVTRDKVVVVKFGRKIPHGTIGKVKVICPSKFGYKQESVLLVLEDGREVWTNRGNVVVKNPENHIKADDVLHAEAEYYAHRFNYGLRYLIQERG